MKMGGGFDKEGNIIEGSVPNLEKNYGVPWDYNLQSLKKGDILTPSQKPTWGANWDEDIGGGEFPNDNYFFYIPRICNHCTTPTCLSSCPREAIFKRDQDGVVLVDLDRCQGYRYCIAGCPYKKIYFNPKISKSEKCILCFPRIERGLPPACAQQCVGRTRFVGFLDDKEGAIYKLVHQYRVALPLRGDFNTQPNVYYIPPVKTPPKFDAHGKPIEGSSRIPQKELEVLFGKEVKSAIKTIKRAKKERKEGRGSKLLDILISYRHESMFRLDSDYYGNKSTRVEERYSAGKFTKKV
jgi:complex iron-sulfur molybdoenzyme family reductase subunit beta